MPRRRLFGSILSVTNSLYGLIGLPLRVQVRTGPEGRRGVAFFFLVVVWSGSTDAREAEYWYNS